MLLCCAGLRSCKAVDKWIDLTSISVFLHQILVPLPEAEARQVMFEELLPETTSQLEVPYDVLVELKRLKVSNVLVPEEG
jgi:hypothetical protein